METTSSQFTTEVSYRTYSNIHLDESTMPATVRSVGEHSSDCYSTGFPHQDLFYFQPENSDIMDLADPNFFPLLTFGILAWEYFRASIRRFAHEIS